MASEKILRIDRNDSEGGHVLVNVAPNGASPLDLKLLATEGESPYILKIRHSHVQKFRVKASQLDEAEWEIILRSILLQRPLDERVSENPSLKNIEISATISGEHLAVIIRKNILGITQRLGEISLRKDDSQEIDSIKWAATAVMNFNTVEKNMEDLRVKYEEQSLIIEKLNQQLEELIKAKIEHETALIGKFRDLLNAKKLKIRDQQRLLAIAKVDPQKAAQVHSVRSASMLSNATKGAAKRKASHSPSANSEDEAFEKMSIDQEDEAIVAATPERSIASETEDEDQDQDQDDNSNFDPISTSQPAKEATFDKLSEEHATEHRIQRHSLPPRRDLPFPTSRPTERADPASSQEAQKTALREGAAITEGENNDEDDETSDDETSDDEL